MLNYKEQTTTGTENTWRRVGSFSGYNPYDSPSSIILNEQEITITPSGKQIVTDGVGSLKIEFSADNPAHVTIYNLLNDLYVAARDARDEAARIEAERVAAEVPPPAPGVP